MASNIDSDTESIISVELDVPSDNQIDLPEGTLSDSSSTNDGTGLLQELESLSDFVEGEQYENGENGDDPSGPERDNDLFLFKEFRVQQKNITSPNFVEKFWEDTDVPEMKAYFGIAVMFGLLNQPRYRNFWSKDPFLGNQGVQRVFSLKRYSKLSEYLHVSDHKVEHNRGSPLYDKLGKVHWLYDHLLQTFPKFKNPERVQVIDEQIMLFSGRISYIQYNVS